MHNSDNYKAAEDLVRSCGVSCVNLSICQLICGLELLHMDESLIRNVTKGLYPAIGECYDATWTSVERNLRSARDAILSKGNRERLEQILGHQIRYNLSVADLMDSMNYYMKRNGLWPY